MNNVTTLMETIKANAIKAREEKQMKLLSTATGANNFLVKEDSKTLAGIVATITDITEKPVYTGYTYASNVETIVAIASTLQYLKADQRTQIDEALFLVFDADTRTSLLKAYGSLPYKAEETFIEINGELVSIDPEGPTRAKEGIKPDVKALEILVNSIALDLELLAEYTCSQQEADIAWANALRKIRKEEVLDSYKDSLVA